MIALFGSQTPAVSVLRGHRPARRFAREMSVLRHDGFVQQTCRRDEQRSHRRQWHLPRTVSSTWAIFFSRDGPWSHLPMLRVHSSLCSPYPLLPDPLYHGCSWLSLRRQRRGSAQRANEEWRAAAIPLSPSSLSLFPIPFFPFSSPRRPR